MDYFEFEVIILLYFEVVYKYFVYLFIKVGEG